MTNNETTPELAAPELESDVVVAIGAYLLALARESAGAYGAIRYLPTLQEEHDESSC